MCLIVGGRSYKLGIASTVLNPTNSCNVVSGGRLRVVKTFLSLKFPDNRIPSNEANEAPENIDICSYETITKLERSNTILLQIACFG
jgi:hypothetical protein